MARRPARGGALGRLLYPLVLARARAAGAAGPEDTAWGWLPPPLVHEGLKVQAAWLHDYLLNPSVVRPAAVLRMPRFNFSEKEVANVLAYFAAAESDLPAESPAEASREKPRDSQRRAATGSFGRRDENSYRSKSLLPAVTCWATTVRAATYRRFVRRIWRKWGDESSPPISADGWPAQVDTSLYGDAGEFSSGGASSGQGWAPEDQRRANRGGRRPLGPL